LIGLAWVPATKAEAKQSGRAARLGFKYDPQAHAAAATKKGGTALDLEPAEPGVVRLPKYEVVERPLVFTEDEMLTPQGRVDLAKKRYLAPIYQKTLGPLAAVAGLLANPLGGWNANTPEALALYYDDDMKRRNAEMRDLEDVAGLADAAKAVRAESRRRKTEKSGEK
jgi:hypothetical protein